MVAGNWFHDHIVDPGRLAWFSAFLAFVVTFIVTRLVTRTIHAGRGPLKDNITTAGLHVHHAVPGLALLIAGAFTALGTGSDSVSGVVAGVLVGTGTSLVLDEFALILRLEDVYWSEEGRVSVEMVSLAIACLGLLLVGVNPIEASPVDHWGISLFGNGVFVVTHGAFVAICVAKHKYRMALFGAFIPFVALIGAVRLARPSSRWAQRWYSADTMQRARDRATRFDRRYGSLGDWVFNFVAGRPAELNTEYRRTADLASPAE